MREGGPHFVTVSHRERFLEGLAQSIRERGLASTQITDIVRHARASRTTFYKCFADKETCFVELVREATTIGLAYVEDAVDPEALWNQQVEDAINAYFTALTADPALTVAWSRDLASLGARGVQVQQEGIERYAELVRRLTGSDAMRRAGVREITMDAAIFFVAGTNAMIVRAIDHGDEALEHLAPIATEALLAMLAPI